MGWLLASDLMFRTMICLCLAASLLYELQNYCARLPPVYNLLGEEYLSPEDEVEEDYSDMQLVTNGRKRNIPDSSPDNLQKAAIEQKKPRTEMANSSKLLYIKGTGKFLEFL